LAEAYTVLKDEDKRRRYDNGTLNDDFYYPEEDEEIRRFGHHAHSFHDFFGFLFARMFARHGRGAFMVDPDDDGDDAYDSAEEDDLTDDDDDDEDDDDDDDDDESDQYYDADPNWRSSGARGAPSNFAPGPHSGHSHHHHPHSSDPAFASRLPSSATPDPRELAAPDQLKRPKVTLQKADLIVTWGYNNGPRKPVDTFILEMKRDGPVAPTDKANPHHLAWQVIYTGQKQSVKVSGLDAGCIYKFRVKAGNGAGESPASAETSITTPKTPLAASSPLSSNAPPSAPANHPGNGQQQKAPIRHPPPAAPQTAPRAPQAHTTPKQPTSHPQQLPAAPAKQQPRPAAPQPNAAAQPLPTHPQPNQTQQMASPQLAQAAKRPSAPPASSTPTPPPPVASPKSAVPKKTAEQITAEKKAADLQAKALKLTGELEAAISKKSKAQIESIFTSAKKSGIKLPSSKVDAANAALKEVQAQQERDRALNVLRQRLQQAISTKSLTEVKDAVKEAESFPGKGLQQQILEAHQLLDELEKDADVQRRLDDAIKAKDAKLLERLINEAKAAGIPIKDAKKVLRGLVKGREVQDQIAKALSDHDVDALVDVLLQHKDRPPRDQEAILQMEAAVKRVSEQLRSNLELAIRNKDPEAARSALGKASSLSIDLKSQMSAQWRQQLEAVELEEIRGALRAALRAPPLERANLLQATLDRAATSPHSMKLQVDIDSAIQELERLAIEESVRFQLQEALTSNTKDKLLAAIQVASPMSSNLQKELDQAKLELDRILDMEERRHRPAGPPRQTIKEAAPLPKPQGKQPVASAPASGAPKAPTTRPDESKPKLPAPTKAPAQPPFPAYAKAASVNSPSKMQQPITILTNKDREEFPPLGGKAAASELGRREPSHALPKSSDSHDPGLSQTSSSPMDSVSILQPRRKQPEPTEPKLAAGVPALASASSTPKLAQSDPTLALFQALLGGAQPTPVIPYPTAESHFLGSVFGSSSGSTSWLSGSAEDSMGESLNGVESSYVPAGLQTGDWAYQPSAVEPSPSKTEQGGYSVFGNPHPLHQLGGGGWSPLTSAGTQPLGPLAAGTATGLAAGDSAWSPINLAVPGFSNFPDFTGGWYGNAFGPAAPPAGPLGGQPQRDPFQ
jgi:hypothetical protein